MRDDFTAGVRDVLAHRAGFRCSMPDCRAATAGPGEIPEKRGSIGVAAHITAAAPGGPRYDEALSSEERGSVVNGIWLCDNHARQIDQDPVRFTPEILRTWKVHAEEQARAMLGRPLSASGLDVSMDLSLQRDTNDGLVVVGETNLPDGTKLMAALRWDGPPLYFAQAKCAVFSRRLLLGPFTDSGRPLPQRWYRVEILSYFNGPWQQPAHVLDVVGSDGSNLNGSLAWPLDPDLDESEYAVRAEMECPAPPLTSEAPLSKSELTDAVQLLQASVLEVQGRRPPRSSEPIIEVVKYYLKSPELRELHGWKACVGAPGIVDVTFSFWNGKNPAEAHWQVILRSREIRYRNRYAKMMSWLPAD